MLKTEAPAGYWRLRNEGTPALSAFYIAKHADEVRTFWRDHVTAWEGSTLTIELDGITYTIESDYDEIPFGDIYGDISADLEAAFERGSAELVWVRVECEVDGFTGGATLGGVECGDYWQESTLLDAIDQILSAVLRNDMLDNARDNALASKQRVEEKKANRVANVARVIEQELPGAASYAALAEKVIAAYEGK